MPASNQTNKPILEESNLKMHFPIRKGFFQKTTGYVKAVDDVSFSIYPGETLGLVGASGCGNTTIGRCMVGARQNSGGTIRNKNRMSIEVEMGKTEKQDLKPSQR